MKNLLFFTLFAKTWELCKSSVLSTCFLILLFFSLELFSSTVILITRGASQTGSVILARTDDDNINDRRIVYVPAGNHRPGSLREIAYGKNFPRYNGCGRGPNYPCLKNYPRTPVYGKIDQAEHTYAYLDGNYAIANEEGVAIAGTDCACNYIYPPSSCRLFEITELSRIALERAATAEEAVKIIGALAEERGYFDWGKTLVVADKNEGWVLEICASPRCSGALWVAKKVPDGEVFVAANEFRIRTVCKNEPDLLYAKDLFSVAEENGWLDAKGGFDWLGSVSPGECFHPYFCLRRVWRLFSRLAPSLFFCPWVENGYTDAYPFSLKPDKKLKVQDVFSLLRDYYQGTQFDLSCRSVASGPFGCPYRYKSPSDPQMNMPAAARRPILGAWERAISICYCNYSHVVELKPYLPKPLATVVWIGFSQPLACCYMPFFIGVENLSESFYSCSDFSFYAKNAFWPFNFVSNLAALKFCYMIKDIQARQKYVEEEAVENLQKAEEKALLLYWENPEMMQKFITDFCIKNAEKTIEKWRKLGFYLFEKYADGSINLPYPPKEPGYPQSWLDETAWSKGPISYEPQPKEIKN